LTLQGILLFTFIDYTPSSYGDYQYPVYAEVIGFLIVALEIGMIPGVAIYKFFRSEFRGSLFEVCIL
jgi:solute carrier family 6 amino acid transporter-like protein 5/7/9/14